MAVVPSTSEGRANWSFLIFTCEEVQKKYAPVCPGLLWIVRTFLHLGRLRGVRQRGPVRGCRPSEAPSALPPDDPAGIFVYLHSHGLAFKGFPNSTVSRGLRGLCFGSFPSFGRVISLRAAQCHQRASADAVRKCNTAEFYKIVFYGRVTTLKCNVFYP